MPSSSSTTTILGLISAIQRGEIDALVLPTPRGKRIFTSWTGQQHYRILVEAMSEGALTLSENGTILYCNTAFAKIVGARLDKVIGARLMDFAAPGEEARVEQVLQGGCTAPARGEISLSSSGGIVPVYVSAQPLSEEGECRICAVVTDLTEVDSSRRAQMRLAAIVEASSEAILSTTLEGSVLSWNRASERLLGYDAAEIAGRSILDIIEETDREIFSRLFDGVRRGETAEDIELVQVRKDGTRVDVVLSLSPILDHYDAVAGVSLIARDNTARKLARRRLASALESTPDAAVVTDHKGTVVLVNTRAEAVFGCGRGEIIGHPLDALIPGCFEIFAEWFQPRVSPRPAGARHEVVAARISGGEFPAEVSVGVVETDDGILLCYAVRDVSERYAIQEALRQKNAQLQAALQAKDRFLATMSHELRTPLTAIIGFTGILLMKIPGPLTDAQVRQLELVRSSARHLLAIISDLLDLARVESGKANLRLEPVSSAEVLAEVTAELAPAAGQKCIQLHAEVPDPSPVLRTDRRFLRQILANLVSNAVKFTDQGSVHVSCREEGSGRWCVVRFAVTDTGIGIQPQDLSRLFTEFGRVQSRTADQREGTGLGLHLSRRMAAVLGGSITAESEFGKGSTFTLILPANTAAG